MVRQAPHGPIAVAPLQQSSGGGSGSFLVRADDGARYWCKAVNNPQGPKVPVTEQVVGRFSELIGAAACHTELVYIPTALSGWEYRPGHHLEEGWVHGSLAEQPVTESRQLKHRLEDDNRARHASFFAVYDWLWGADSQWLVSQSAQWMYFSHDHGWYLPPEGPEWTIAALQAAINAPHEFGEDRTDLDPDELERLAQSLEALTSDDLADTISLLPREWAVTDDELEAVVEFAATRCRPVAARLRAIAP